MNFKKYSKYSPTIVRFGIGAVFLTFGILQLSSANSWIGLIPGFLNQYFSSISVVYFNGSFDLLIGILLLLGVRVRITSFIASLHLISVVIVLLNLGFIPIAVRDIGLLIVLISIFFHGSDKLCLTK